MKTPLVLVILVAACAASGAAGYFAGQKNPSPADAAAAVSSTNTSPSARGTGTTTATTPKVTLDSLLKGPGAPNADDLAAWVKGLSAKDCADLLTQLQGMKSGAARDAVLEAVLGAWAKGDPQGMLAVTGQVKSPKMRESSVDAALKAWAAKDPASALQWLKDNPGTASTSAGRARYAAAIAGYASVDPKGAFDTVSALSDTDPHAKAMKKEGFDAVTDALAAQGKFTDALAMFGDLPTGEARDEALDNIVKQWGAAAPEDAAAWSVAITDQAERLRLQGQIADAWAASDPAAAANWALQLDAQSGLTTNDPNNPGIGPGMILANAILAWSEYDIDGPGTYLNQLPNSPSKDRAVAVFAMHAAEEDPESAANWLGTITDRGIRSGVTMAVGMQMYQQSPEMFNNFVDNNAAIEDGQKQGLKQVMPIMSASMGMISAMTGGKVNLMSTIMDSMLTGKSSPMMNQVRTMQQQMQRAGGPRGVINASNAANGGPPPPNNPNPPPGQ